MQAHVSHLYWIIILLFSLTFISTTELIYTYKKFPKSIMSNIRNTVCDLSLSHSSIKERPDSHKDSIYCASNNFWTSEITQTADMSLFEGSFRSQFNFKAHRECRLMCCRASNFNCISVHQMQRKAIYAFVSLYSRVSGRRAVSMEGVQKNVPE